MTQMVQTGGVIGVPEYMGKQAQDIKEKFAAASGRLNAQFNEAAVQVLDLFDSSKKIII